MRRDEPTRRPLDLAAEHVPSFDRLPPRTLLLHLRIHEITLRRSGDRLELTPAHRVSPALAAAIRAGKSALLAALDDADARAAQVPPPEAHDAVLNAEGGLTAAVHAIGRWMQTIGYPAEERTHLTNAEWQAERDRALAFLTRVEAALAQRGERLETHGWRITRLGRWRRLHEPDDLSCAEATRDTECLTRTPDHKSQYAGSRD